jgi:transposase-like protein
MSDLFNNVDYYNSLSEEHKREFIDKLYQMLIADGANALDYKGLKAQSVSPQCPYCKSIHIKKNGHQRGQQVYKCKNCGKNFRETTGTIIYYLHKKELMLDYLRCMLEGKSIRACAREVGISVPTSFNWKHKILSALKSLDEEIKFSIIIETDVLNQK